MSLRKEIEKNKISIGSLEDDSLVLLFRELSFNRNDDKPLLKDVVKVLLGRKKLELITSRDFRFH